MPVMSRWGIILNIDWHDSYLKLPLHWQDSVEDYVNEKMEFWHFSEKYLRLVMSMKIKMHAKNGANDIFNSYVCNICNFKVTRSDLVNVFKSLGIFYALYIHTSYGRLVRNYHVCLGGTPNFFIHQLQLYLLCFWGCLIMQIVITRWHFTVWFGGSECSDKKPHQPF